MSRRTAARLSASALLWVAAWLAALGAPPVAAQRAATSCISCHGNPDWVGEEGAELAVGFRSGVHAEVGLSCHDCHGGNPDRALAEEMDAAMDPAFAPNPYRGVPGRTDIPAACGRCHSDPSFMRRFRPDARVDQEREYQTSHHGEALARGDSRVATCVDCHGVHGILRPGNPASPVYPTRLASTCGACHSDPERMAGYRLADGRPLPVDQEARWARSVHAQALLEKGDLSAPSCNDCHGNHGATPPGVESIAFVCGQCHGREAELFRNSPKREGFEEHLDLVAAAGPDGCAACHEPPEPQASFTAPHPFTECTSCHGNHSIVRPTLAMLAPLPDTPCAFCHEGVGALADEVPEPEKTRRHYEEVRDSLLQTAADLGLAGEERFDWLVDQAQALSTHTLPAGEGEPPSLRPEFQELFTKFRIGKIHFTYRTPSGEERREAVVRCSDCHGPEPLLGEPTGYTASHEFLTRSREVTSMTARAERILLRARRGGVETRQALSSLEQAVDSQIQLEVLVHSFAAGEGSAFRAKHQEGLEQARAALGAGQDGLRELAFRRRGLAISLVFIALLLVGLGLKIRELSRRPADASLPSAE